MNYLCNKYNIEKRRSSPYHPEGNGQAERTIQSIKTLLRCISDEKNIPMYAWPTILQRASFDQNCATNISTKYSPFELMYGTKATFSNRIIDPNVNPDQNIVDTPQSLIEERKHNLNTKWSDAADNIEHAKGKYKEFYDKRGVRDRNIAIGEYVYVKNHARMSGLDANYLGSHEVTNNG